MTDLKEIPEGAEDSVSVLRVVLKARDEELTRLRVRVQEEFMRRREAEWRLESALHDRPPIHA